jgi:hypothetical protein
MYASVFQQIPSVQVMQPDALYTLYISLDP